MTTSIDTAPFLTLHALQMFPPSLLNRDDNNATKQIVLGGVPRVRVSSASSKRAIRTGMRQNRIDGAEYGLRTNRFPALTAEVLTESHGRPADVAAAKTAAIFRKLNLKATDKGDTAVMVFAHEDLPKLLASVIDTAWDEIGDDAPKETVAAALAALDPGRAIDVALFGRMLAEVPVGGRIEGASGVMHSFSVDAAAIEPDFWTAVDDAAQEGQPASSNLGEAMVSAPVLYRSASLDRRQLHTNLASAGDEAPQLANAAERAFIEWFIRAVPAAKQHSSVAATLPSIVVATTGPQVISAAAAFTTPVTDPDVMTAAASAMLAGLDRISRVIDAGQHVILSIDPGLDHLTNNRATASSIAEFADTVATR